MRRSTSLATSAVMPITTSATAKRSQKTLMPSRCASGRGNPLRGGAPLRGRPHTLPEAGPPLDAVLTDPPAQQHVLAPVESGKVEQPRLGVLDLDSQGIEL